MIISTQTECVFSRFDEKCGIEMFKNAGFSALDYSMFFLKNQDDHVILSQNLEKYALELKKIANENGIIFNQTHAPFPTYILNDTKYNESIFEKLKRSIEFSAVLGAGQVCIHPVTFPNDEDKEFELNLNFYNSLSDTAKKAGIRIGIENMFWTDKDACSIRPGACGTSQRMIRLFDALNDDTFVCLLDIGHCGLVGEKADIFIKNLGNRLGALHVHDNDFKYDMHTVPFSRSVDFKSVTKALSDVKYKGEFTFEADMFLSKLT